MLEEPIDDESSIATVVAATKTALAAARVAVAVYLTIDGEPTLDQWSRSVIDREHGVVVVANPENSDFSFVTLQFERRVFISGPNDRPPRSWVADDINPHEALRNTNIEALHWLLGPTASIPAPDRDSSLCELNRERAIANSATPEQTRGFLQHERGRARVWLQAGAISQFTLFFRPIKRRLRFSQPGSRAFVTVETGPTVPALDLKPTDDHATFDRSTAELLQNWPGSDRIDFSKAPPSDLIEPDLDDSGGT